MEETNKSNMLLFHDTFGDPSAQLNAAERQNQILCEEIQDLKGKIKKLEGEAATVGNQAGADGNLAKDKTIEGLQKEINDLKVQRADLSREVVSFKEALAKVKPKGETRPLREANGHQKQSLTLKFDDSNDKL